MDYAATSFIGLKCLGDAICLQFAIPGVRLKSMKSSSDNSSISERKGSMQKICSHSGGKGIGKIGLLMIFGSALMLTLSLSAPAVMAMEYGATGPYSVTEESFENPLWKLSDGGVEVTVLLPEGQYERIPVIFFSHGIGGMRWQDYRSLLTHIASQGFAVVFSPYPASGFSSSERYRILWNGFKDASDRYSTRFDLNKVGFLGHSYGAGATPAMAWKGIVEQGWGAQGAFLFPMAPYYTFELSDSQFRSFPDHTNLIMMVFSDDDICPHKIAQDVYSKIAISLEQKAYYYVQGRHSEPSDRSVDNIDRQGIYPPLDALMDYTFNIDRTFKGKAYALDGEGYHYQTVVLKNAYRDPDSLRPPEESTDDSSRRKPVYFFKRFLESIRSRWEHQGKAIEK
jgi:pimeloyl-ACP methyl ester carboxylesterase